MIMDILEDKSIIELVGLLKTKIRKKTISSKENSNLSAPRFIFICGKEIVDGEKTIRSFTIDFLKKHKEMNKFGTKIQSTLSIISESLYLQDLAEDIFSFEKMLAELSDKIIIVAESPGTFCELGAFVMDERCRKKTIVINEDKDSYQNSFITKGPIKKLETEDENSIILHNGLERIKNSHEYKYKIEKIAQESLTIRINNDYKEIELKSLIYELANIIELFQPLEYFEVETLYKTIKDFPTYTIKNRIGHKIKNIRQVVLLMEKLKILNKEDGYYTINNNISCYNVLFKITRKEFNDFRIKYLNRIEKCQRQRMEIL